MKLRENSMKVSYYYIKDEIHGRPITETRHSDLSGLTEEYHPKRLSSKYAYVFIDIQIENEEKNIEQNEEALRLKELVDIPLDIIEEIITDQRPRADNYVDFLLILFKYLTIRSKTPNFELKEHQVGVLIRDNVVFSIHKPIKSLPIETVFRRFNKYPMKMAKGGITFLVTSYLDLIIDQMYHVLEYWTEMITNYELKTIKEPDESMLYDILKSRHYLLDLVKILQANREIINSILKSEIFSKEDVPPELDDHVRHLLDECDIVRDLLTQLTNMYYASDSAKLNATMKRLTFITSLLLVPSLIAGIFGMNFFTGQPYQMLIVVVIMVLIISILLIYFKRKDFL
ncbi:MAG: hypothetical protein GF364_04335 [Candidatus Lokiarchaeota archaeon]|nr:hypothetical protein [Candidatus Lokiarchaeota archaeon]